MNKKLKQIYEQDQKDRKNWRKWGKEILLEEVQKRDKQHLEMVLDFINSKKLVDSEDYYYAATILQHSREVEHYKLANELCKRAIKLGEKRAKWLYAATLDRYLLESGQKFQKYGTQYEQNEKGEWRLCPVGPNTTDDMRAEYNVPSLEELKAREGVLNGV